MSKTDLTKHQGINHEGPDHSAPYPVSRMAPSFDIVDLAKEIAQADAQIGQHLNGKLKVIAEQIRLLQNQAREILDSAHRDQELHRAKCNFKRIPGRIYHLYQKPDEELYFSMLSPQEWGQRCPHDYLGSFRLEADMSWTASEDIKAHDSEEKLLKSLLSFNPEK